MSLNVGDGVISFIVNRFRPFIFDALHAKICHGIPCFPWQLPVSESNVSGLQTASVSSPSCAALLMLGLYQQRRAISTTMVKFDPGRTVNILSLNFFSRLRRRSIPPCKQTFIETGSLRTFVCYPKWHLLFFFRLFYRRPQPTPLDGARHIDHMTRRPIWSAFWNANNRGRSNINWLMAYTHTHTPYNIVLNQVFAFACCLPAYNIVELHASELLRNLLECLPVVMATTA